MLSKAVPRIKFDEMTGPSSTWRREMNLASYIHKVCKQLILVKPEVNFFHRHAMKSLRMSGGLAPFILDLDTRRKGVASLTLWSLYSLGELSKKPGRAREMVWALRTESPYTLVTVKMILGADICQSDMSVAGTESR